jgi:ketol-acid reductoisomerase
MAKTLLYDADIDPTPLAERAIAVIGYGSQGSAQALCLRDMGHTVLLGLRHGQSWDLAVADGWTPVSITEAVHEASVIALLTPDSSHESLFRDIQSGLANGDAVVFAHGFSLLYEQVKPPSGVDVVVVAPMGAGPSMRELFVAGSGVSGFVAVHQDATGQAQDLGQAYAKALGCGRAGVMVGTVREEVETDLFGEQAVLCGGLAALAEAGYDTLVAAGYSEELAYFECVHQLKLLADLIHQFGIAGMRERISDTALFGDLTRGKRVIGAASRHAMQEILEEIQSGAFANEWLAEQMAGLPASIRAIAIQAELPMEAVGRRLRNIDP